MKDTIVLTWTEKDIHETKRIGVMYCFHSCDINRN